MTNRPGCLGGLGCLWRHLFVPNVTRHIIYIWYTGIEGHSSCVTCTRLAQPGTLPGHHPQRLVAALKAPTTAAEPSAHGIMLMLLCAHLAAPAARIATQGARRRVQISCHTSNSMRCHANLCAVMLPVGASLRHGSSHMHVQSNVDSAAHCAMLLRGCAAGLWSRST